MSDQTDKTEGRLSDEEALRRRTETYAWLGAAEAAVIIRVERERAEVLTLQAIVADPWNAVALPFPENPSRELLEAVRETAGRLWNEALDENHRANTPGTSLAVVAKAVAKAAAVADREAEVAKWLQELDKAEKAATDLYITPEDLFGRLRRVREDAERQQGPMTLEAILREPWHAVVLPLPHDPSPELLSGAREAAAACAAQADAVANWACMAELEFYDERTGEGHGYWFFAEAYFEAKGRAAEIDMGLVGEQQPEQRLAGEIRVHLNGLITYLSVSELDEIARYAARENIAQRVASGEHVTLDAIDAARGAPREVLALSIPENADLYLVHRVHQAAKEYGRDITDRDADPFERDELEEIAAVKAREIEARDRLHEMTRDPDGYPGPTTDPDHTSLDNGHQASVEQALATPEQRSEVLMLDNMDKEAWNAVLLPLPPEPSAELVHGAHWRAEHCYEAALHRVENPDWPGVNAFEPERGTDMREAAALALVRLEQLEAISPNLTRRGPHSEAQQVQAQHLDQAPEVLTLDAIERDPVNAIRLDIPEDASRELLVSAYIACANIRAQLRGHNDALEMTCGEREDLIADIHAARFHPDVPGDEDNPHAFIFAEGKENPDHPLVQQVLAQLGVQAAAQMQATQVMQKPEVLTFEAIEEDPQHAVLLALPENPSRELLEAAYAGSLQVHMRAFDNFALTDVEVETIGTVGHDRRSEIALEYCRRFEGRHPDFDDRVQACTVIEARISEKIREANHAAASVQAPAINATKQAVDRQYESMRGDAAGRQAQDQALAASPEQNRAVLSIEAIQENMWNAVALPIPDNASTELLTQAYNVTAFQIVAFQDGLAGGAPTEWNQDGQALSWQCDSDGTPLLHDPERDRAELAAAEARLAELNGLFNDRGIVAIQDGQGNFVPVGDCDPEKLAEFLRQAREPSLSSDDASADATEQAANPRHEAMRDHADGQVAQQPQEQQQTPETPPKTRQTEIEHVDTRAFIVAAQSLTNSPESERLTKLTQVTNSYARAAGQLGTQEHALFEKAQRDLGDQTTREVDPGRRKELRTEREIGLNDYAAKLADRLSIQLNLSGRRPDAEDMRRLAVLHREIASERRGSDRTPPDRGGDNRPGAAVEMTQQRAEEPGHKASWYAGLRDHARNLLRRLGTGPVSGERSEGVGGLAPRAGSVPADRTAVVADAGSGAPATRGRYAALGNTAERETQAEIRYGIVPQLVPTPSGTLLTTGVEALRRATNWSAPTRPDFVAGVRQPTPAEKVQDAALNAERNRAEIAGVRGVDAAVGGSRDWRAVQTAKLEKIKEEIEIGDGRTPPGGGKTAGRSGRGGGHGR